MNKIENFQSIRKYLEFLGCHYEKINDSNFTVHNRTTLKWKETGTKIGKIYIQKSGLKIEFDFPVNAFSQEELIEISGLPFTDDPKKIKGSYLNCSIGKDDYDTLRIKILSSDLVNNFDGENLKKLLSMVVSANN